MWIAISLVAIAVLFIAVFAGRGKLGEMPGAAVNDRPKGHVPEGPVTPELLAELRIPVAFTGYKVDEVDDYLDRLAAGAASPEPRFAVGRRGYDMQVVDDILDRATAQPRRVEASEEPHESSEVDDTQH